MAEWESCQKNEQRRPSLPQLATAKKSSLALPICVCDGGINVILTAGFCVLLFRSLDGVISMHFDSINFYSNASELRSRATEMIIYDEFMIGLWGILVVSIATCVRATKLQS